MELKSQHHSLVHPTHTNLRISGCAICLFRGKDEVMLCEENRVVLSYAEQTALGSKQPYMVPASIVDHSGAAMDPLHVGRLIHMRKNKRHSIDATISNEAALQECRAANENHSKFSLSGRHFQHVVLRERLHKGEAYHDACARLLREEFYRKFKGNVVPQYDFVYQRESGSNALLVYLIHVDDTIQSNDILQKKGVSNYFCAKDIPGICNNDYNETRNHQFLPASQARSILLKFSQSFPADTFDTSHWGALDLFDTVMRHSKQRRNSPSYRLIEQIGRGAYSVVWRAERKRGKNNNKVQGEQGEQGEHSEQGDTPIIIAVKEMMMRNVPAKRVERVLSEIAAMQSLRTSPNIVELYGAEEHHGSLLLAMELCTGGTLRGFIQASGPLSDRVQILNIVRGISSGLSALRSHNLVHRDLKPSNILFQKNGGDETDVIRLADFGMSRSMRDNDTDSHVCGTIRYMAPEMLTQDHYGPNCDLWSLGCIVYELIAGTHPFLDWEAEKTCETITRAMTLLLGRIIQCRGPGNVTEVAIPAHVPFHMMIGKDSPVRIIQGLLQEHPTFRWTYAKLFEIMRVTTTIERGTSPEQKTLNTGNKLSLLPPLALSASASLPSSEQTSKQQRRRTARRQMTMKAPDGTVRRWFKRYRVGNIPLGRDHLITLSDRDSCLEALRVLLEHQISSAPVVHSSEEKNGRSNTTVLGFVDVLDLVTLMIRSHSNEMTSVLDALVSDIRHAVNLSGSNKLVTVRENCGVAECLPLLVGGVKRLAVVNGTSSASSESGEGGGNLVSVLTQSEMLRWIVRKVTGQEIEEEKKMEKEKEKEKNNSGGMNEDAGKEQIGKSAIAQKLDLPIDEVLNLTRFHKVGGSSINNDTLLVVESDADVASAFMLLANHRLSAAPVVDVSTGAIVGVFSASDIRKMPSLREEGSNKNDIEDAPTAPTEENDKNLGTPRRRERRFSRKRSNASRVVQAFASLNKLDMKVSDYIRQNQMKQPSMTTATSSFHYTNAITVTSNDSIRHVCELLSTHSIHRVYVVDQRLRPYAVVSIADVLHAIVTPNIPFDVTKCPAAQRIFRERLEATLPKSSCVYALLKREEMHAVYVDNPFRPTVCIAVIGSSIRHGNREVAARVLDLSSNRESQLLSSEERLKPSVAQSLAALCSWVVRRALSPEEVSLRASIMWCGLDQSMWTIVQRTMHIHGCRRTTIEKCQMYAQLDEFETLHEAEEGGLGDIDSSSGGYFYRPLSVVDAPHINSAWKYKSESSLKKIQQLIIGGLTMAAYSNSPKNTCPNANSTSPVCWMVTYENGSIGMLHTVPEHRRRNLATNVVRRLIARHHQLQTTPPPVLYIVINNHASRRLFEEKLKWSAIANVAWVRYVQTTATLAATATDTTATVTTTATTNTTTTNTSANNNNNTSTTTLQKGVTVYTPDANLLKWEGWYASDMLPPWDTAGKPCFALSELLERMPTFPTIFPNAIDVGTGGGSNACWLKKQGFQHVVGVDVSNRAVKMAMERRDQEELDVELVVGDIFCIQQEHPEWVNPPLFDFLVDVQVFHAIYQLGTTDLVRSYAALLRKRGVALVVTGNDREGGGDGCGPSMLSKDDLIEYFTVNDYFRIADIKEARFDPTHAYGDTPPLCWVCLFVRSGVPL